MALHGSGLDSFVGIGKETTWGTRVVPTRFLPFNSETLQPTKEFVSTHPLMNGIMVQPEGLHRESTRSGEGAIEMELYDRGMGMILDMLHGNVVTVTTPGGATLTRQQVHVIGQSSPLGKGLSIQVARPATDGTLKPYDYMGCKIVEAVISVEAGEAATISFTLDVKDEDDQQTLATPTYVATAKPFTFQDCTLKIAGSPAANVRSATITIPLGMATDRYHLGNQGTKDQPLLNEHSNITVASTLEFRSTADHNRFKAGAPVALDFEAVGSLIESTFYNSLKISMPSAKQITPANGPVNGPDILTSDAEFEVKWNGSAAPLTITTLSTDTTL